MSPSRYDLTVKILRNDIWFGWVLFTAVVLILFGCKNKQVKVEMRTGVDGAMRVFETNFADRDEINRLSKAYENDPMQREKGEGFRFEGTFDNGALPSEVGNRNGLSSLPSNFGTAWYYYEQFGEHGNDWEVLKRRMNAGDLWLRLAARFFELRMPDEETREEWREFAYGRLIPDALSGYLRYTAGQFVTTGQRVSAKVRLPNDRGPRTMDENFQVRVFTPLIAFAAERGWMSDTEAQMINLLGIDGWVSAGERDWSRRTIFEPIMRRFVQRFVPGSDPGEINRKNEKLTWIGISFLWWVNTSSDAVEVLLASDAISEKDKERLRNGDRMISIPGPFGFSITGGPRPLESELELETGAEPFLTNGDWKESFGKVYFRTKIYPEDGRRRLAPPVFYAAWSIPNVEMQEEIFGTVALKGQALAEYCLWVETLKEWQSELWMRAVEKARTNSNTSPLRKALEELDGEGKDSRPPPTSLRAACAP